MNAVAVGTPTKRAEDFAGVDAVGSRWPYGLDDVLEPKSASALSVLSTLQNQREVLTSIL
jgi:hypothetical protein